jgi:ribonuclease HI
MKTINIFTDGAVPGNQKSNVNKGGVGVFFGINDTRNISYKIIDNKITNQITELTACIMALETIISTELINNKSIIIYSDSMYVINSITKWADDWKKNDWRKKDNKPIQNLNLIKKLYYLSKNLKVKYIHVKAHTKKPDINSDEYYLWFGNYMADKLAVEAI